MILSIDKWTWGQQSVGWPRPSVGCCTLRLLLFFAISCFPYLLNVYTFSRPNEKHEELLIGQHLSNVRFSRMKYIESPSPEETTKGQFSYKMTNSWIRPQIGDLWKLEKEWQHLAEDLRRKFNKYHQKNVRFILMICYFFQDIVLVKW